MGHEIQHWPQILTILSEILWGALPLRKEPSHPTPKTRTLCLLLFGVFEKLHYICKREREICVSSTEPILFEVEVGGWEGCATLRLGGRRGSLLKLRQGSAQSNFPPSCSYNPDKCPESVSHVSLLLETCRPSALPKESEPGCSLQSTCCWLNQG